MSAVWIEVRRRPVLPPPSLSYRLTAENCVMFAYALGVLLTLLNIQFVVSAQRVLFFIIVFLLRLKF